MSKQKYNWPEIKLKYMTSKHIEVKSFLVEQFGCDKVVWNWNFERNTKGWRQEKEHFMVVVKQEAQLEMKEELIREYKPTLRELWEMLKAIIDLLKLALKYEFDSCIAKDIYWNNVLNTDWSIKILRAPKTRIIESVYKIVKRELWDAMSVYDIQEISEEDMKLINSVLDMNF